MHLTQRVAIVAGLRTPFERQAGFFKSASALDLARPLIPELLLRHGVKPADLELLVLGSVLPEVSAPNIARELIATSGLSVATDGWSVSRACTTSLQAVAAVADQIQLGRVSVAIAGGSDSASCVPITLSARLARRLLAMSQAKTWRAKLQAWSDWSWTELRLQTPSVRDYATGLRMGDAAEQMALDFAVSRVQQDQYALDSHQKATKARQHGALAAQILPWYRSDGQVLEHDGLIRQGQLADYQALKPAFDRRFGSVTAANSCALTDGAAALLLMSEAEVLRRQLQPLGWLKAMSHVACDPASQMLLGPAYAIPKVLQQAGLTLADMDLIELHEAFSAQVLATTQALASDDFAQQHLRLAHAVGQIAPERLNPLGGSLAYGHPFAATGARLIMQGLTELQRRQQSYLLVAACAAGGLGSALILEAK